MSATPGPAVSCARCATPLEAGDLRCAVCALPVPIRRDPPSGPVRSQILRCIECGAAVAFSAAAQAP